jgi:RNA polymerase sigma-70 factor (ECF subfamily)
MLFPILDPRSGDRFAHALETCRRFLLGIANARMPGQLTPRGGASDLVQETLVKAYTCREQFHGRTLADLRAWLRCILQHELIDFHRRCGAACRNAAREAPAEDGTLVATEPEPVESLIRAERDAAVAAAVARLPMDAREVLTLRLELRLGFREIGERTGRGEDAARKAFTRALERLRGDAPDPAA